MKGFSTLLLSGMVVVSCAAARADSIKGADPEVIMGGGNGSFPIGHIFSFISPSGTSPITLPGGSPAWWAASFRSPIAYSKKATSSTWTA
jgi:hypothetical protein